MFNIFRTKKESTPRPEMDWAGLHTQCLANIRYLRAHINVLNGNIEHLKVTSSRAARAKIATLTETRNWMQRKLEEEELTSQYFEKRAASIVKTQA